jgi:hypothetical protein
MTETPILIGLFLLFILILCFSEITEKHEKISKAYRILLHDFSKLNDIYEKTKQENYELKKQIRTNGEKLLTKFSD